MTKEVVTTEAGEEEGSFGDWVGNIQGVCFRARRLK